MLPALVEDCTKYLWRDLYPRNACRAYEFAKLFEEQVLMEKGLQVCFFKIRNWKKDNYINGLFTVLDISRNYIIFVSVDSNANERYFVRNDVR